MNTRIQRRPVPRQTEISATRRTIVMIAMALGAFAIGTTEFTSMGLLPLIADDFGITEDTASVVISVYALGVVVGAPIIAALTAKLPRRRLIILLIAFLLVGNLLTALAPNYGVLLVARFIAGLPHGAYFSVANLAAASMAPPGKQGFAMSMVGMGLSVATVIGVPAAQALGQGLGWHSAYYLVVVLAALTMVLLFFLFPHMTRMPETDMFTELGALKNSQVRDEVKSLVRVLQVNPLLERTEVVTEVVGVRRGLNTREDSRSGGRCRSGVSHG